MTRVSIAARPNSRVQSWRRLGLLYVSIVVIAGFVCALVFFVHEWPFREDRVVQRLQNVTDSQVSIRNFRSTYFPPGCILEGVVFRHGSSVTPLIAVEQLTIKATLTGIIRHHVRLVKAEGLHVSVPPFGTGNAFHTQPSHMVVDELVANGALVDFSSQDSSHPALRFDVHESLLRNVSDNLAASYRLRLHNPTPAGELTAAGKIGPWTQGIAQTPFSGEYLLEKADLGPFKGIGGTLSSHGKFAGSLEHVNVSGTTDTPNFTVDSSQRSVNLRTEFTAYVDATKGDVFLRQVNAHFGRTDLVAVGSVAKHSGHQGKFTAVEITSTNGRIEDILGLFTKDKPPMSGSTSFKAEVSIPPGPPTFLKKVQLLGRFGVGGGEFSQPSTQQEVNRLSAGARGEKNVGNPATVLTDLKGAVNLEGGVAYFSDLSFGIPGAAARLQGSYNVLTESILLYGKLRVESNLSNSTSGLKSVMLKVLTPFYKEKKGEVLPVHVTGTFDHPSFGLDPKDKKADDVPAPPERASR